MWLVAHSRPQIHHRKQEKIFSLETSPFSMSWNSEKISAFLKLNIFLLEPLPFEVGFQKNKGLEKRLRPARGIIWLSKSGLPGKMSAHPMP